MLWVMLERIQNRLILHFISFSTFPIFGLYTIFLTLKAEFGTQSHPPPLLSQLSPPLLNFTAVHIAATASAHVFHAVSLYLDPSLGRRGAWPFNAFPLLYFTNN